MNSDKEYKVLARKYRPQKFIDLIGQEFLVNIITNSINNNRIAHSYVLTGVRGVGKTTTARLIAMSLNCQKREKNNHEPCGNCESCNAIKHDQNMDVIEMDAASKTGVDDVREIIENVKYKPVSSLFKIFIIDEVHMLSKNAFNALLKTLEEPPDHVKFIFATTEVKKIPITILSRCQRFDLQRVTNSILTNHLLKIAGLEKVKIDKDAMALIVRGADGSVRDGLSLLDQAITNNNDLITSNMVIDMLGLADRGKIFDLLDHIFKGDAVASLKIYNDLHKSGADIVMIFDEMLNAVHFITQLKLSPILEEDIYIPELERSKGKEISLKISMNSLGLIWQILFKGFQELQYGLHLHHLGEMIILRLIYVYEGPTPGDLLKNYNSIDKKNSDGIILNKTIKENKPTNDLANKTSHNTKILNESNNIKGSLKTVKSFKNFVEMFYQQKEGMLHSMLYNDVKLISFKEGEIVINTESIKDKNFNRNIAKLISKWTGRIWQVHSSTSNLGKSMYEEDLLIQQEEISKMKNRSEIKNFLDVFPNISIHSITDITEIDLKENIFEKEKKEKEL